MTGGSVTDVVEMVSDAATVNDAPPPREARPPKPPREPREAREPREPRGTREPREARESREPREPREQRETPAPQPSESAAPAHDAPSIGTQAALPMAYHEPAPVAPAPVVPAAPVVRPAPVAPAPRPVMAPLPPVALTLPPDSGLVLVETSHPAPSPADDESSAPRPKRVRPPRVEIASEPLEIIETRKDSAPPAN